MRIAEELLLLAIHPVGGRPVIGAGRLDLALAGAILADLALAGRIVVDGGRVRAAAPGPVPVPAPPRDPELDGALAMIDAVPGVPAAFAVVRLSGADLRVRLRNGLIGLGILAEEEQRILGVLRSSSHPELNPAPRRVILARLDATLAGRAPIEAPAEAPAVAFAARTAALLVVAHACGLARALYPEHPDLDRRVGDIAATTVAWTAHAVAKAIADTRPGTTASPCAAGGAPAT
ncbi:GOLPH3/VPS74 family protein [Actinomadura roseirufa]|uniref:GOLPH3/VPS74 family protein n=1 Tax=Actinomadura roseirufa TaxID=2094049 RepID=UPI001040E6FE|nr:GPP34 family phosphoprotein [Actinomadura roseirufa]